MNLFFSNPIIVTTVLISLFLILGYLGLPLWVWSLYGTVLLGVGNAPIWLWVIFAVVVAVLNIPILRQTLITYPIIKAIQYFQVLPRISDTGITRVSRWCGRGSL